MLEIRNLTRKYLTRTAVDNVTLDVQPGLTYALLGPNGSGKTTLMKMIAGLTKPTSGSITFNGQEIGVATKAQIAYMPTENYFYNYMSIADAGRYYADFFRDFDRDQFAQMLARMDLNPRDKIRQLSSGMSAKVRLALTLCRNAKLMMFDEPLNGVDILTRAQVVDEIVRNRASGRSMIISTHLVDELDPYIDYAIYMKHGIIELMGSREELGDKGSLTDLYLQIYGQASGMEAIEHA